jgi:hypothetical protein
MQGMFGSAVEGITNTAAADQQYNSYHVGETSTLKTYKKMMTIHLKDKMFRKLKCITSNAMLEFLRSPTTLYGYVCTQMRVPDYQWGDIETW